ncbi:hypothetical protein BDV96DRAFT_597455 [Lophiotrema nucula]|uniref:BTB domain-containing protein n=1 Tax=Lophiotrema nucula TaxID=690887 RepID=A0A6A5ZEM1_9PLEO|nr:hypothetical protein BDV96DRAFT_597455 [Lophiotrema nucula]
MATDGAQVEPPDPEAITVKVGPQEKKYILHTAFLSHYSGYFRGALSGKFSETDDGVVKLKDVDTDVFSIFADWIYNQQIPFHKRVGLKFTNLETWSKLAGDGTRQDGVMLRYRAYCLADRLLCPKLKCTIFEQLFDDFAGKTYPNAAGVTTVVERLPERDPLLRLVVDTLCISSTDLFHWGDNYWEENLEHLPQVVLAKVASTLGVYLRTGAKPKLKRSDYDI